MTTEQLARALEKALRLNSPDVKVVGGDLSTQSSISVESEIGVVQLTRPNGASDWTLRFYPSHALVDALDDLGIELDSPSSARKHGEKRNIS